MVLCFVVTAIHIKDIVCKCFNVQLYSQKRNRSQP
nr:MAG TPA: hypothetical protein [Caudoviricetes sp.]